jgi:hypothetical protein
MSARFSKRRKDVIGDVTEEVVERRECQRSFRGCGLARQQPGGVTDTLEHVTPDRGLTDPGIASDNKCIWCPERSREKHLDFGNLGIPPD